MAVIFNGIDLSTYGLVTPKVTGVHDLSPQDRARAWIPGRDLPADVALRRQLVTMSLGCVLYSPSGHAGLVSLLQVLKRLTSPELGFVSLGITDRPSQRTFARSLGFSIGIDQLPFDTDVVEFEWRLERYPYWEDDSETEAVDPTSINNSGDLPAFPVYTCDALADLIGGLYFEVGSKRFTWEDDLNNGDTLVVETDLPTVTLNGETNFAGVASDSEFPELVVGTNAVTKSSEDFTLTVSYRKRYE
mgnify:CR=1 FL=1